MDGTVHVIVIDDNPDDRRLVVRELRAALPAVRVTEVADAGQLERVLRGDPFHLVVTDYELRWTDGISVLRAVKARHPLVPVIMFTGSGNEEVAVEAMKGGLDDYVVKSARQLMRLRMSVLNCLRGREAARRATLVEVRQQTLLNRLSVGVCRLTLGGELVECNPAFLKLMAVGSLDEARSLDLTPFRLPDAERERLLSLPADNGHHAQWQAEVVAATGERRWVAASATLSTVGERTVADYVIDDVTAQHQITERLAAANAAKDQFIAQLSHELRTPLTPVLGIAAMLEGNEGLPAEVRADMATIRRNVELEARLVDDLLDFSRLSQGGLRLHHEVVDAHEVVRTAWDTCRREPGGSGEGLRLSFALDARRHHVWADRSRVHQVLFNVFLNALRFTPAGGGIEVTSSNPGAGELRIDVRDTGIGIGPDDLARLVRAFEQVRPAVRPAQAGLGLGLTIARRLAELHGGTLTARSEGAGKGATFTLALPVRAEAVEEAGGGGTPARAGAPAATAAAESQRPRVLLVEDSPDTLAVMVRLLRMMGYEVATAGSVREAREVADGWPFDVLVSDIGLPDGTGHQLLRELAKARSVRAVAVSGYGTDGDRLQSREAGFVEHLVKPVDVERLRAVLARLTGRAADG
jgi:signal transduction histidine kinase